MEKKIITDLREYVKNYLDVDVQWTIQYLTMKKNQTMIY